MDPRWLFADQLGPHFLDDADGGDQQEVLLVESRRVLARRRFHRQKAHLVLSALRHRAAELGDRCRYVRAATYAEALEGLPGRGRRRVEVVHPTSYAALRLVRARPEVSRVLPPRGFATPREEFERWAAGRGGRRLLMEDFYRGARRRHGLLLDDGAPAGGRWNLDHDNRQPPPKGRTRVADVDPWWPEEDEIDEEVRADLDRWERAGEVSFVGRDGPRRFAVTRGEAERALERFAAERLAGFGPHEDAMLGSDDWMAHSLLSAPMNLGLLHPLECARRAEAEYRAGRAPLASVEGYVRQLVGWRDYVWHVYWHAGEDYARRNALGARRRLPRWFADLDADAVGAHCLRDVLAGVRDHAWVHHIPRLMVLGGYALQRGWSPQELTRWFHLSFVDGYEWVMVANVVGMSQHADGGFMATKPYLSGGAYIDRMSDYCRSCPYSPKVRVGDGACPYTAGYWWFVARHRERLAANPRTSQVVRGLGRLRDLDELVVQEERRHSSAP